MKSNIGKKKLEQIYKILKSINQIEIKLKSQIKNVIF